MRRWLLVPALLIALLALAACAAEEKATPAPAAPTAAAKAAWEQEWEQVVAAAKREGKVTVAGFAADVARKNLTEPFERKYGITVEYTGLSGPEFPTRIRPEREAGQYLWDLFIGGTTTTLTSLKPMKALDPIEPALILPEVKDPKVWLKGQLDWCDKDRTCLAMLLYGRSDLFINTSLVKSEEFKSFKDLLNPKWKGKILLHDPRIAGPSQAVFTFWYQYPELGIEFIRAMARQEPIITRETQQEMEWVAQGRYPILIGGTPATAFRMKEAGAPIAYLDSTLLKEGGYASPGWGAVSLINRAPHPNAAKLYLNWLLSKEGQLQLSKAAEYASQRLDVPRDHVPAYLMPQAGYGDTYSEKAMEVKDPLVRLLKEVFGE